MEASPATAWVAGLPPVEMSGLSSAEARARLAQHGPNELARTKRTSALRELVRGLSSPLMLILLAASALAASVGEVTDASIIAITLLLGAALDAFQTSRSTAAVERLRQSVIPTATVWRDRHWSEIARREVVPGDVIHLSAGDVVPADAWLASSRDLHVQQAALTGESFPAEKQATPAEGAAARHGTATADPNQVDAVFLGTSVVSGVGIAVVSTTGMRTAFGEIAARLRDAPPPTEIERGLRHFGALLAQTVVFLVLFLVLVSVALRRDPLESLIFAIALAVGVVPEFMPMVTSITLATGAVRMARQQVIVKHLAAIHNFGSVDILCSDKTGTLTRGEMQLEGATDAAGANAPTRARARRRRRTLSERHPQSPRRRHPRSELAGHRLEEARRGSIRLRATAHVGRGRARRGNGTRLQGRARDVIAVCASVFAGGKSQPLDDDARTKAIAAVHDNGSRGLRTLAVAWRALPRREAYGPSDETDLTLGGWLTFADPPMDDADAMVAALARDGVALKILTGDDDAVAHHVCSATGIDTYAHRARHGARQDRRPGARRAGGAHDSLCARFTATEAADHSCAQGARARRRATSATGSTTPRRCTLPTSGSRWPARSTSRRTRPTSSFSTAGSASCTPESSKGAKRSAT